MKKDTLLLYLFSLIIATNVIGCSDLNEITGTPIDKNPSTRSASYTNYYWYNDQKVGINKIEGKKFVLFKDSDKQSVLSQLSIAKTTSSAQVKDVTLSSKINRTVNYTSDNLKWTTVESSVALGSISGILYEAPYFSSETGEELGLSHLFYVKLKNEQDITKLKEQAKLNKAEVIGNNAYMPLWYTLSCSKNSTGNALELANKFYESGLFAASEPDFMFEFKVSCVNDPLFSQQWNLNNTGQKNGSVGLDINYCNARSITQGSSGVIVAVIDQGVELTHPDLNIYSKSYDTENGSSPSLVRGNHGTACAGIISAKANNNLGVAGIAPNCPLMSISNNLIISPDLNQKLADGFNYAWHNGASVISNSWYSPTPQSILTDGIQSALTNGRNGLGCIVAFAAGNDNRNSISYPANAISDILAIGAISPCGERKSPSSCDGEPWGSNYGTALDVVTPGVFIPTTDRTGSAGYSTDDYYSLFNGTSSACPHVAATAALILSVNPNLTQKEVANIIESTARKAGSYTYSTTSGRANGTWNNEMGYGLLNAFAAVSKAADNPIIYFNDQTVSNNQTIAGWQIYSQNVIVSNGARLTFTPIQLLTINPPYTINNGCELVIAY